MAKGYIQINVYSDSIGQPVENALIEIIGKNTKVNIKTNDSGQTEIVDLECPDKKYSMEPQLSVRPYEVYTVIVRKEGLEDTTIEGVEIFDGTTAIQNVFLKSDILRRSVKDNIEITEHALWGDYAPKIVVDPDTQMPMNSSGDILPVPIVPEQVVVHDGLPNNQSAPNYYIAFADYIKNVASSEIYSTWPKECIRANVYAILSFTLNRIYLEWYPSKGYAFTITSSTQYDQKFIYGRNIFKEISDVVDQIFQTFIKKGTQTRPYFSQYNDGVKVNNPGWLSQWGSKYLADEGYSALEILKYYYGNTVSIDKAPIIEGMPTSFPGYNLQIGICGDAVQKMQLELNIITGSFPGIPKISNANGKYTPETKRSVEVFQSVFSLPVTGIVDFATWYRISNIFIGVSNLLQSRYEF